MVQGIDGLEQLHSDDTGWRYLCRRNIQKGADGELVYDGDIVYVLRGHQDAPTLLEIDYFHGVIDNQPIAQMMDDSNVRACDMISIDHHSKTIKAFVYMQRKYREIRRRWGRFFLREENLSISDDIIVAVMPNCCLDGRTTVSYTHLTLPTKRIV